MQRVAKFEKVSYDDTGIIPTRADSASAGYDFYSPVDFEVKPNESVMIKTNIKAQMENDEVLLLFIRSSVGIKRHLVLSNGTGVIDSSYYNNIENEGNIMCSLYNYGTQTQKFEKGERIMQGVFVKHLKVENDIVINATRKGGIGSSGK